jgi:hypothetical protein
MVGIITICSIFFINFLKNRALVQRFTTNTTEHRTYFGLLIIAIVLTPVITLFVSNNDFLRYGLEKKTTYRLISIGLDKLSDIDSDGYGSFSYPKDKAVFNASIYPDAFDIPGNDIDEDGFLGDAVIALLK